MAFGALAAGDFEVDLVCCGFAEVALLAWDFSVLGRVVPLAAGLAAGFAAAVFATGLAAGFAAGFIDSIAGGGGLITVPVLMLAGLSPEQALATNKVQGSFGAATAAVSYARSGLVDLRAQLPAAALAFAAGVAGAVSGCGSGSTEPR